MPVPKTFEHDLDSPEERNLINCLLNYQDTLAASYLTFKPNILAQYLLTLCKGFNHFYHNHKVIGGDKESSRILLVSITQKILEQGLGVLGVQTPDAM